MSFLFCQISMYSEHNGANSRACVHHCSGSYNTSQHAQNAILQIWSQLPCEEEERQTKVSPDVSRACRRKLRYPGSQGPTRGHGHIFYGTWQAGPSRKNDLNGLYTPIFWPNIHLPAINDGKWRNK